MLVGVSVGHNFLKGREAPPSCSYRSTCLHMRIQLDISCFCYCCPLFQCCQSVNSRFFCQISKSTSLASVLNAKVLYNRPVIIGHFFIKIPSNIRGSHRQVFLALPTCLIIVNIVILALKTKTLEHPLRYLVMAI